MTNSFITNFFHHQFFLSKQNKYSHYFIIIQILSLIIIFLTSPSLAQTPPCDCSTTCGCANRPLVYTGAMHVGGYQQSCDQTTCDSGCTKFAYGKIQSSTGIFRDLYGCTACPCSAALSYFPLYWVSDLYRGIYSCSSTCTPGCYQATLLVTVFSLYWPYTINYCTLCPFECLTCTTATSCLTCNEAAGYYFRPPGSCLTCQQIYGPQCTSCNVTQCFGCNPDYCLTNTNTQCWHFSSQANCLACIDGPICTSCDVGFFPASLISTGTDCLPCNTILHCVTCELNQAICNQCDPNFALDFANLNKSCIDCTTIPHTAQCIDGPEIISCVNGYYPDSHVINNNCVPCNTIPHCSTCSPFQAICTQCVTNYHLDFASQNKACVVCSINNCITCYDGPRCSRCITNYIPDPITSFYTCISCLPNEFSQITICYVCSNNLTHCTSCYLNGAILNCTSCETGWVVNNFLSCYDCKLVTANCSLCSDMYTCTKCIYPYKLGPTGLCDECQFGYQYVDSLCTKPRGCSSFLPDYSRCLACFAKYNYVYDAKKDLCVCRKGYESIFVKKATLCISVCGNGYTITPDEECDDGNIISGDGCDSNCKVEDKFKCTYQSPSNCDLHFDVLQLNYNYAFKYEAKNRGKFSFSISPVHTIFKFVDWSKYLTLNISTDYIVQGSQTYEYDEATNEISVVFDYKKTIQEITAKATLKFDSVPFRRLLQHKIQLNDKQKSFLVGSSSLQSFPKIISNPSELSLIIKINGINDALVFEQKAMIVAYQVASKAFLVLAILILLQFFIGSYFHKMIGLQTIQVIQFCYFVTMAVDQKTTTLLKTFKSLKYAAYGGYSNFQLIYGSGYIQLQSLSYNTVDKNFLSVGLMKYLLMNINFSIMLPLLALIVYFLSLMRKRRKRNQYLQNQLQDDKDLYTDYRRSSQWVYDHFVFPFVNMLNMAMLFCTILYQQSGQNRPTIQIPISDKMILLEKVDFLINFIFILISFFMFAYQIFLSYDQYQYAQLTQKQKQKIPTTMIQELQHDENNTDRQNYKPGYVLLYSIYYLLMEVILMGSVLIDSLSQDGIQVLLGIHIIYVIIFWIWNPYYEPVNFHNKALKFYHLVVLFFLTVCQLLTRVNLPVIMCVVIIYLSLVLLFLVAIIGFVRIFRQYLFRRKLQEDPHILDDKDKIKLEQKYEQMNRLKRMKKRKEQNQKNLFRFENQMKDFHQKHQMLIPQLRQQIQDVDPQMIKRQMRKQIFNKNKLKLPQIKIFQSNKTDKAKESLKQIKQEKPIKDKSNERLNKRIRLNDDKKKILERIIDNRKDKDNNYFYI